MMIRKHSWLIGLICTLQASAQEFAYQAGVEPAATSAFYKITLSPELLGKLKSDFSDLRIYSQDGKEQPYFIQRESVVSTTSLFKEYEVMEKVYQSDAISHLIFHNPGKKVIDNVSFVVKNTDVQKRARLSGSDDKMNWYVIKDNYLLHSMHNTEVTTELKILNFPLSDYEFFKLEINDNWKLPINILKVGFYDTQEIQGNYTEFNCPIAYQKDSLKTTYVKLVFPELLYLEVLNLEVSGADYYARNVKVSVKKEILNDKKKLVSYFESLGSFELNSNSKHEIEFGGINVKELYFEIENKDNQPLIIDKVVGSYLNQYLVAKLAPSTTYLLRFGNEKLSAPEYDIVAFASQIPLDVVKMNHKELQRIKPKEAEEKESSVFDNVYLIWLVIAVVGTILAFVSVKMIREIGKAK